MKKIFLLALAVGLLLPFTLNAQTETRRVIHEPGFSFVNLNGFGLSYKTGGEKTLFRIHLVSVGINSSTWKESATNEEQEEVTFNAACGVGMGVECRIPLVENFYFYSGADLMAGVDWKHGNDKTSKEESKCTSIDAGLGVIIGFGYAIKSKLVISAEVVPGLFYSWNKTVSYKTDYPDNKTTSTSQTIDFHVNNNTASITLAYRFGK